MVGDMNPSESSSVYIGSPSQASQASSQASQASSQDLLDDTTREKYRISLYKASMEGDWKAVEDILDEHKKYLLRLGINEDILDEHKKYLLRLCINGNNETTLHVAVSRQRTLFVKNLMNLMQPEDLELQDNNSCTALCVAVTVGDAKLAKLLVAKHMALVDIANGEGKMPLQMAASSGNRDMVNLLYDNTQRMRGNSRRVDSRSCVLLECVGADLFDVALRILQEHPDLLALSGGSVLRILAQKPQAFKPKPTSFIGRVLTELSPIPLPKLLNWDKCSALHLLIKILKLIADQNPPADIYDILRGPADPINDENIATNPIDANRRYSSRVLFLAAEAGNIVFIVAIIDQYPEVLQDVNDINQTIFHVAVSQRYVEIYDILFKIGSTKDRIVALEDENGNNMLHLVGILTESAKSNCYKYIPGAAQLMQQELLWFKEAESMLPFSMRKKKNNAGFTPREEFTKYHKDLVSEGEKWMKDTGAQLIVAAALLAAISFTAAVTFAGGYNQNTGYPMFRTKKFFRLFIFHISMTFFSASASIINVLSLLASSYAEDAFSKLLPYRLMLCVATLYWSVITMIVAFLYNLFLLFEKKVPTIQMIPAHLITLVFIFYFKPIFLLSRYAFITTIDRKFKLRYDRRMLSALHQVMASSN